jgi:arylsulfatase A-like enzyme
MSNPARNPDIVVVVLDCVRAADFLGGSPGITGLPFCEELRHESVTFPRAISPAPWTIPSHASLFSGLSPWETGCHWKGNLRLSPEFTRLPTILAAAGYRTMTLSANPVIEPSFGLVDGFQQTAWSGWWEPFLRYSTSRPPHLLPRPENGQRSRLVSVRRGPVDKLIKKVRPTIIQHPSMMVAGNRVVHHLREERGVAVRDIAQWIEPTFENWVARTPADQPLFAFVNLLDAHEPYFPDESVHHGLSDWREFASTRQDPVAWMNGDWRATADNFALMHRLYCEMIASMDRRLRNLVDVLKTTGRWENTALILTSDHGQAFGEHGTLFHFFRVDEQLIRVPLWVRLPLGEQAGTVARGWANLIDIAPTACELAGRPQEYSRSGHSLNSLIDAERPEPALAISDGIVWGHFRSRFTAQNIETFDRVFAAAYLGDQKVVIDVKTQNPRAYNVAQDPGEAHDQWTDSPDLDRLATFARAAGERTTAVAPAPLTDDVEDRLKAWGYI